MKNNEIQLIIQQYLKILDREIVFEDLFIKEGIKEINLNVEEFNKMFTQTLPFELIKVEGFENNIGKLNLKISEGGKIQVLIEGVKLMVEISDLAEENKEK